MSGRLWQAARSVIILKSHSSLTTSFSTTGRGGGPGSTQRDMEGSTEVPVHHSGNHIVPIEILGRSLGRPVRATITLYPIGRPVRATYTITLYPTNFKSDR